MSDIDDIAPWMQTASGGAIDLLDPRPSQFRLWDLAISLARIPRFNGHTTTRWSVACHSLLTEKLLPHGATPEARLYTLLHDAHEMCTGDIVAPVKALLAAQAGVDLIGRLERALQKAIHIAAGLQPVNPHAALTKQADLLALAVERRNILSVCERPWTRALPDVDDLTSTMTRVSPGWAPAWLFITRFETLAKQIGVIPHTSFMLGLE